MLLERCTSLPFIFVSSAPLETVTEVRTHIPLELSVPKTRYRKSKPFLQRWPDFVVLWWKEPWTWSQEHPATVVTAVPLPEGGGGFGKSHILVESRGPP